MTMSSGACGERLSIVAVLTADPRRAGCAGSFLLPSHPETAGVLDVRGDDLLGRGRVALAHGGEQVVMLLRRGIEAPGCDQLIEAEQARLPAQPVDEVGKALIFRREMSSTWKRRSRSRYGISSPCDAAAEISSAILDNRSSRSDSITIPTSTVLGTSSSRRIFEISSRSRSETSSTRKPRFRSATTNPSFESSSIASRTGVAETPKRSPSAGAEYRAPGSSSPATMAASSARRTCSRRLAAPMVAIWLSFGSFVLARGALMSGTYFQQASQARVAMYNGT